MCRRRAANRLRACLHRTGCVAAFGQAGSPPARRRLQWCRGALQLSADDLCGQGESDARLRAAGAPSAARCAAKIICAPSATKHRVTRPPCIGQRRHTRLVMSSTGVPGIGVHWYLCAGSTPAAGSKRDLLDERVLRGGQDDARRGGKEAVPGRADVRPGGGRVHAARYGVPGTRNGTRSGDGGWPRSTGVPPPRTPCSATRSSSTVSCRRQPWRTRCCWHSGRMASSCRRTATMARLPSGNLSTAGLAGGPRPCSAALRGGHYRL